MEMLKLLCEQNSKHRGAKNEKNYCQKQVFMKNDGNSDEENCLAAGCQNDFGDNFKE